MLHFLHKMLLRLDGLNISAWELAAWDSIEMDPRSWDIPAPVNEEQQIYDSPRDDLGYEDGLVPFAGLSVIQNNSSSDGRVVLSPQRNPPIKRLSNAVHSSMPPLLLMLQLLYLL